MEMQAERSLVAARRTFHEVSSSSEYLLAPSDSILPRVIGDSLVAKVVIVLRILFVRNSAHLNIVVVRRSVILRSAQGGSSVLGKARTPEKGTYGIVLEQGRSKLDDLRDGRGNFGRALEDESFEGLQREAYQHQA